ncbi:MAG: C25 family cysteine peptidase [Bacteroidales bacterium]
MNAEWIPLDKTKTSNTPPKITLLRDDNNSTVIKIEISGFDLKEFISEDKTFQAVDLLSEMFSADPGYPALPYIAKVLAIPDQAGISVEVLETGKVQTFRDIYLPPARSSWLEGETEPPYLENRDAYRSEKVYPKEIAKLEPPAVFRDFRIARISVFPVRYVPAKKELQVVSSITVRINYGHDEVVNPRTASNKAIAPSFAKLYRSFIFNYQEELNNHYGGREDGREVLLCIMPDIFVASFQIYADWKRQSGYDVHVTKFSDIGGNPNNPYIMKSYIADCYHNWEYPPTYVLIVGDDGVFPKKIVTYPDYSFPNEDYFVEIDGLDYFPEMMIGRFTNEGDYRMQVMINKFMLYEKNPYTANTAWFKKGTVCSNNAYASQVQTKRFAASVMLQNGGFTSVDTLMSDGDWWGQGCTVDLNDIITAINEGRSYLNYRGEGWSSGWQASCYNFFTSDVSGLNNGQKFTFVTSIGCGVTMFDAGGGNCFGEEWVEEGSLTSPRGGVAFVGPTSNTHTTYNNMIDMGIYIGMFQEGMDTPGEALLRGKLYMYNVFGNEYYVEYHYKIYCVLGDPSIHIWKDVPKAVNLEYPDSIMVGPNQVELTVTFASSGDPVENAQVCLAGDEIFATGFCGPDGKVILDILPVLPDTLTVTVRGGNVIPFQDTIEVLQPAELVEPDGNPLIVDLDGNTDGLVNPNENCNITFTLKNWGSQTASDVMAVLYSSDPDYLQIITTGPVSYGNLASGATFTGNPFQFYVSPDCPVGQVIPLQLHIISSFNAWDYYYNVEVKGCKLVVNNFMINDAGSPNANYRMDPGETVMLFISIMNEGEDVAPDVMGILSSDDPYITIVDSIGTYGTVDIDSVALNTDNYFVVSVSAACPTQYLADYSLKLYTQDGNYPYQIIPTLYIPVSLPIQSDYTGPDAYGYYAYSSDDFFDQAPDYDWFEIDGLGNPLNIPGIGTGDYTETVNLPFTFKYYGIDYYQLRISTDGWIALGSGAQTAPLNTPLPNNDNVNCMVAGFWDDLYDSGTIEGKILYYYDNENHRYIIEWDSIARNDFGTEPNIEDFQSILLDPDYYPTITGDGEIIFQYKQIKAPQSCTIGIENHSQDIGLQYVYNANYDPTASELKNEFAIKITTEPPFVSIITSIEDDKEGNILTHSGFVLEQNQPNPFYSHTWINYSLPEKCNVSLNIFNIKGELVRTLQNGKQLAGKYSVEWNGQNNAGNTVSSGIYFYHLQTEGFTGTRKMFILR